MMINVALALAARGFEIFPCDAETRSPLVGFTTEATTNPAVLRTWWERTPNAMPAILLGPRRIVVDVDPRKDGDKSLGAWLDANPEIDALFKTVPRVTTARGGWHFYFSVPEGVAVKNGEWLRGVDLKTGNAYVIAPGAVRSDGLRYSEMSDGADAAVPDLIVRARARDATPDRAHSTAVVNVAGDELEAAMTPGLVALLGPKLASKGQRHDVCRAVGGALAVAGWTDEGIAEVVRGLPSDAPDARVRDALDAAARARAGEQAPQWGALERAGYAPGVVAAARTMADGGRLETVAASPELRPVLVPPSSAGDGWGGFTVGDITKPLPPVNWLCEGMVFAPGAPTIFAGYGGVGKSMLAQSFAVAVATGRAFLQSMSVRRGKVLHFDYEQGRYECNSRYQRLACAMFRDQKQIPGDVLKDLEIISPPPVYMNAANREALEEALKRKCDGAAFALVDSLRACCPGVDENDSQMREPLDMLFRVSESTGCAFGVIHHARKTSAQRSGQNENMRGTSAINDAAQTVIMCEAFKEEDTVSGFNVICAKVRLGKKFSPFALILEDVPLERVPFAGLEFKPVDGAARAAQRDLTEAQTIADAVCELVRTAHGGVFFGGRKALYGLLAPKKFSQSKIDHAIAVLITTGRLIEDKDSTHRTRFQLRQL